MLASARLDTVVCLRCQLRRTIQQIAFASRTRPNFAGTACPCPVQRQSRHQSNDAIANAAALQHSRGEASHLTGIKHFYPHGKIRGRKGRQHREASEPLQIESLGKPSEVIVLRDVPTPRRHKQNESERPVADIDKTAEAEPSLTPRDIQATFSKQGSTPKQNEVNAAIEEMRPEEDVVTKTKFEKTAQTLHQSYSFQQLRDYLHLQIPPQENSPLHRVQILKNATTPNSVTILEKIPWQVQLQPLISKSDRFFPGALNTPSPSLKLPRKQTVINRILRQAWHLRIEEEAEAKGTMHLLLTPAQWTLLQTNTSSKFFGVLRSEQFHKNTNLERDKPTNSLCIIGPRGEAEDIASLVEASLINAKTHIIHLGRLKHLLASPSYLETKGQQPLTFSHIFTWDRLSTIMGLTKSSVVLDVVNEEV